MHEALKCNEKTPMSGFLVFPGSADALVKGGGKIKHILLLTFSVTVVPKIIKIDSHMSNYKKTK